MAGLTDVLGIASRGLQVVQRGIATTSHNVANANTEGYSRQRNVLTSGLPIQDSAGTLGTGVEQQTIERIVDQFTIGRLRSETSRAAGLDAESNVYSQIEAIVNDQLSPGLTDELSGFFDSVDDLANAAEPGQPVERGALLAAAESLVDTIHSYDAQLRDLQKGVDRQISAVLPEVNAITDEIARLNGRIAEAEAIAPANDLRDQRDQLLVELSEKLEIRTLEDDAGMVSVQIAGGIGLVNGRNANDLVAVVDAANPNPFDPTYVQVHVQGSSVSYDATSAIRGGELGALIGARDGIVGDVIRDLDAFAYTLADSFNTAHRAGLGLVDGAPHDFFSDLSGQPTVDDAARNLGLSADVDPAQGGTLDHIAAGSAPNPVTGTGEAAPGDTSHVEVLKDLRRGALSVYRAGDVPGTPSGGSSSLAGSLTNLIGDVGQQARSTARALEQQRSILGAVKDRRDAVSGVSVDEEVTNLIELQTSFQANARVISTVSRLFDDLLSAF